jgi:hypothetical protein
MQEGAVGSSCLYQADAWHVVMDIPSSGQEMPNVLVVAIVGAVLGTCSSAIVAFTMLGALGIWPARWENLVPVLVWGGLAGSLVGVPLGAAAGIFMCLRARRVDSFRRLAVESVLSVSLATIIATEIYLTTGYSNVQRLRVALAVAVVGGGLAAVGMRLLKPLYWRR